MKSIFRDLLKNIPNFDYLIFVNTGVDEASYNELVLETEKIYNKIRKFDKNL